jgi:hypothetical protein
MDTGMYTLAGAFIGLLGAIIGSWASWRSQQRLEQQRLDQNRAQLLFKEKADKVHQFANDLGAAAYAFILVTWNAKHDSLDKASLERYWSDIRGIMPRLYGDSIILAALDDELGKIAASLIEKADKLDVAIGEVAVPLTQENIQKLVPLHEDANQFADVLKKLADEMKGKRLAP